MPGWQCSSQTQHIVRKASHGRTGGPDLLGMDSGPFGEPTGKAGLTGYPAKALWVEDKGREIRTPHLVGGGGGEGVPKPRGGKRLKNSEANVTSGFLLFSSLLDKATGFRGPSGRPVIS